PAGSAPALRNFGAPTRRAAPCPQAGAMARAARSCTAPSESPLDVASARRSATMRAGTREGRPGMSGRRASSVRLRGLGAVLLGGACTATIGDRPVDSSPPAIEPAPSTLHRLTQAQYTNALHDLLGANVDVPQALEPDLVASGFATVGGSVGGVSRRGVE